MPTDKSKRECAASGCHKTTAAKYCPAHADEVAKHRQQTAGKRRPKKRRKDNRPSAHKRGYGKNWRELRLLILRRDPVCVGCRQAPARHVDHIRPKSVGGTDDPDNLQGLCAACHNRKTKAERNSYVIR